MKTIFGYLNILALGNFYLKHFFELLELVVLETFFKQSLVDLSTLTSTVPLYKVLSHGGLKLFPFFKVHHLSIDEKLIIYWNMADIILESFAEERLCLHIELLLILSVNVTGTDEVVQ